MSQSIVTIPVSDVYLHTIISQRSEQASTTDPALLLLHFWGGSNQTFSHLINRLSPEFHIIAPSLRGWGKSSKPEKDSASQVNYRIRDHTGDIVTLIQHLRLDGAYQHLLNNGIIVLGHSMGGKIAQTLLTRQEINGIIRGLVLVAPAPAISFSLPDEMREQQIHAYDNFETAEFVIQNVLLGRPDNVSSKVVQQLARNAVSGAEDAKRAWPAYGMSEDYGEDIKKALQKMNEGKAIKVLVVGGQLDRAETVENVNDNVVMLLAGVGAEVEFTVFESVGHLIPIEAVGLLAEAVKDFVASI